MKRKGKHTEDSRDCKRQKHESLTVKKVAPSRKTVEKKMAPPSGHLKSKSAPLSGSDKKSFEVSLKKQKDNLTPTNSSSNRVKCPVMHKRSNVDSNWEQLLKTLEKRPNKSKLKGKNRNGNRKGNEPATNKDGGNVKQTSSSNKSTEPEIWFDDVDDILVDTLKREQQHGKETLVKPDSFEGVTKCVAMDCEMVGTGYEGRDSMLARVSMVNQYGQKLYDKYVKPTEKVTDYRTHVSGITPKHLIKALPFKTVQKEVSDVLSGRVLVGHAIHNDLKVLFLDHPRKKIRDTSRYKPFRQLFQGRNPSLKNLTQKVLGVSVQQGEHDSIQDAQATMRLYTMYRKQWEKDIKSKFKKGGNKGTL